MMGKCRGNRGVGTMGFFGGVGMWELCGVFVCMA